MMLFLELVGISAGLKGKKAKIVKDEPGQPTIWRTGLIF